MKRLKDKVAIVTGGSTGIGEAISKKFAREGAKVIVAGFEQDPVDDVVSSIREAGYEAEGFKGDLSSPELAEACVRKAVDTYGKLDILINNAGVFPEISETQEFSIESFDNLLKNNCRTTFLMTRFALPHLHKTKGNIIAAGSESGKLGLANATPYGGTKGFVHAFIEGLAVEQARHGVRANAVCPGPVDTAWTHKETSGMTAEMEKTLKGATAMGRRGTPEEVANVYLFLASDEASYVTGSLYEVDGGTTVVKGMMGEQADESLKKQPSESLRLDHDQDGATERR